MNDDENRPLKISDLEKHDFRPKVIEKAIVDNSLFKDTTIYRIEPQ